MRWIGGSSTMALMQSFRELLANRPQLPIGSSPESDIVDPDSSNVNTLYFPGGLGFGHVHALPATHEVEWPPRDLADKLVSGHYRRRKHWMTIQNFYLRSTLISSASTSYSPS
jgi:hypothetical protein